MPRAQLRRLVRRSSRAGFTLIELMVVVVLISILALLAVPSMLAAREDRLAFRTANSFARLIHDAHTRALGRGAAQLVVVSANAAADRGTVTSFESLDAAGRPVSSCKNVDQWLAVLNSPPGSAGTPVTAFENANGSASSLQVQTGLESTLAVNGVTAKVAAVCFTPGGRVYVTTGADVTSTIALLPTADPFTTDIVVNVVRKPGGGVKNGLTREVIMTANGATRIHSI